MGRALGSLVGISDCPTLRFLSVLSELHIAIWKHNNTVFVATSFDNAVATFWPMSLVGIYPGRASCKPRMSCKF